jgi:hypothetical protein
MKGLSGRLAAVTVMLLSPAAFAFFHTFSVDQIYSNASGTVQFVTMTTSLNGENFSSGVAFNSSDGAGSNKTFTFPNNLPSSSTAGKHILIATQSFAALGLVTPDFVIPDHFIPTGKGTVGSSAGSTFSYNAGELPTDGVNALYRSGGAAPNLATNFAGNSASVVSTPTPITPAIGLWWNPDEPGSGYTFDVKHGTLVVTVYTYDATGHSEWYLASGPLTVNGNTTSFSATLDKYRNGQCVVMGCAFHSPGPPAGNDGVMSIAFTSPTSATMTLPGRVTNIQPYPF